MEKPCSAVIIGVGPEQGLGATLAKFFAAKGLHVYIGGRSEDKLHRVAEKIRQTGGSVSTVIADATVERDVADLFRMALDD
ncbi:MAG: SDR family NAD(P)-dependent oxidoreductase, partial [Methylobacter sp.]